ncbi:hypothetical protein B0H34DRAFT_129784 [Crassisporium funariophilum]|nr:hypothetical protein B0H34DRAFT_129784 [Crassisporium funariophilum]
MHSFAKPTVTKSVLHDDGDNCDWQGPSSSAPRHKNCGNVDMHKHASKTTTTTHCPTRTIIIWVTEIVTEIPNPLLIPSEDTSLRIQSTAVLTSQTTHATSTMSYNRIGSPVTVNGFPAVPAEGDGTTITSTSQGSARASATQAISQTSTATVVSPRATRPVPLPTYSSFPTKTLTIHDGHMTADNASATAKHGQPSVLSGASNSVLIISIATTITLYLLATALVILCIRRRRRLQYTQMPC